MPRVKWNNASGLPDALCKAIENSDYDLPEYCKAHGLDPAKTISTTTLVNPPQLEALKLRADYEEDYGDMLFMLMGSAVHYIIERSPTENSLTEERLHHRVGEWTVAGKIDDYSDGVLRDWKFTSRYAIESDKPEWDLQANINAWLLRKNGFEVNKLEYWVMMRDWSKTQVLRGDTEYTSPFALKPVDLWPDEKIHEYIVNRVLKHSAAREHELDSLHEAFPCTAEETWERPAQWKVFKIGGKRASKVFDNEADAAKDCAARNMKKNEYTVKFVRGERGRCAGYCPVASVCQQWNGGAE
jgi:hypothetical protein